MELMELLFFGLLLLTVLLIGFGAGYYVSRRSILNAGVRPLPSPPLQSPIPDEKKIDPAALKHLETPRKELKILEGQGKNLIVVAYRLPVSCVRSESGEWTVTWDDARNFLSNLRVLKSMTVKWVGYPGFDVPKSEREKFDRALAKHNCYAVHLGNQLNTDFYEGFCKGILWPLFHYVLPQGEVNFGKRWDELWQAFQRANMMYRKLVESLAESPTDSIWIQNYHLLLLPSLLRKNLARARIGIFIHTPWPSSDVFRILPLRDTLLRGVMGADLVGFHTYDYARHFLSVCKRVLEISFKPSDGGSLGVEYSGRFVSILISHVGIDSKTFAATARDPVVRQRAADIRSKYKNRSLILGVDDLDQVKCSLLKLQAYERFLSNHEEVRDKVTLVQIVLPSSSNPTSREFVRNHMLSEAKNIKETYGEDTLDLIEKDKLSFDELVAYYSASNVAFVSTFWDGLNLAPFEYTATQDPAHPGVLILSEFMGCSRSLSGVLRVNPWNLENVSESIYSSLMMPVSERIANHKRRSKYVMEQTLEKWASGFLESLDLATKGADDLTFVRVGFGSNVRLIGLRNDFARLEESTVVAAYRQVRRAGGHRILLFDYDGTLTAEEPDDKHHAVHGPSPEVLEWLKILTADPHNTIFILSGRKRSILWKWFGRIKELGLAAEKGCFLRWPQSRANEYRLDLQPENQESELNLRPRSLSSPSLHSTPMKLSHSILGSASGSLSVPPSAMKSSPSSQSTDSSSSSSSTATTPVTTTISIPFPEMNTHLEEKKDSDHDDEKYHPEDPSEQEKMDPSEWEVVCPIGDFVWKTIALDVLRHYTRRTDGSWIEDKEFGIVWHFENADPEYGRMQADEVAKLLKGVMKNPLIDVILYDFHRILEVKPIGVSKGSAASRILQQVLNLPAVPELPASGSFSLPATPVKRIEKKESKEAFPFLLCVGDDKSDEDMFIALESTSELLKNASPDNKTLASLTEAHSPLGIESTGLNLPTSTSSSNILSNSNSNRNSVFTCCVGIKPSAARYYLQDDGEVRQLLQAIAEAHKGGGSGGTTPSTSGSSPFGTPSFSTQNRKLRTAGGGSGPSTPEIDEEGEREEGREEESELIDRFETQGGRGEGLSSMQRTKGKQRGGQRMFGS